MSISAAGTFLRCRRVKIKQPRNVLKARVDLPAQAAPPALRFRGGIARMVPGRDLHDRREWREAFALKCKDHRFYELIEQTLDSGFEHHYLVLEDASGDVRAVQPLFFVQQNLVEGVPALRASVASVRRRFPRFLTMRILMVGCAAGDSHLGCCRPEDEAWVTEAMGLVLKTYARACHASLVVWKDFPAPYRRPLRVLSSQGYARVPSMPLTRLSLRAFCTFDDYLRTLSKATRKDLRRKFRAIAQAAPITCEVLTNVAPFVDEIHPLYLQVRERSAQKFECLTKAFFSELGRRMPDRARFFLWRQEGRLIAFSLCLVHDGTIYDDYLGLDYGVALDLHLYFHTLRDILGWAIEQGLTSYCSSPLNYKPKLQLGCELVPLDLYVLHTRALFNPLFRRAVKYLEPTRHDPVLKRFANAHELT
jgi:predicted N-acyltransferase